VVKQAGYDKIKWQGKWHSGNTLQDYGFTARDPPDAGNYLTLNDMLEDGIPAHGAQFLNNIVSFIKQQQEEPWCLVHSIDRFQSKTPCVQSRNAFPYQCLGHCANHGKFLGCFWCI
jgi:hypothetical protein